MKNVKRVLSIVLCIVLMLSSAPVLNLGLFKTDAGAVSYAKKHEKEYYYADGTQFITYMVLGYSTKKASIAKAVITDIKYTLVDKDLNSGISGKNWVYVGYLMGTDPANSIKDLRIRNAKNQTDYTAPENGATYTAVGNPPISEADKRGDKVVDLNNEVGGDYLYYFATKNVLAGDPIIGITIDNNEYVDGYETVKFLESANFNIIADANKNAGGDYIYTHIKRLPQVDTTKLRETMETADEAIASKTFTADSKVKVEEALTAAKKITDAYDKYRAGTDAYSNKYSQTDIDNAKKNLEDSFNDLRETIDTSNTPRVKFYVPETIYLNPDNGTSFQYMYGVDSNGVATQTELSSSSSAKIYFAGINCNPTSVKITCEASTADNSTSWRTVGTSSLSSITFGGKTFNGTTANSTGISSTTFPVETTCSSGSLSSAVGSGNTRYIRWRADYVLDGLTYTIYSYSVCYRQPAYTAYFRHSSRQHHSDFTSSAMVNAVLTVSGINTGNYSGEQGSTDFGSKGSDNNNGKATLEISTIIDSTRFANYKNIPYFGAKYAIPNSRDNKGTATTVAYNSNASSTTISIGTDLTAINLPINSSKLVVYMHAKNVHRGETAQNYTYFNIKPILVNKASLRSTYNNEVSQMRQQKMFNTGFDTYQDSVLDVALKLGTPTNQDLTAKITIAGMERKTGTVTTTYFNERTGSAFSNISSENKKFTSGECVSIPYKAITGYSLSSYKIYSGSTELTTGSPNDTNTYYIRSADGDLKWEFRYTPNKYTATYDPNGGSYNGTAEASTNQGTYETAYSVGVFDGTAIDNPTRTGYVFAGWKCDANGSTYNSGDSLNWSFTKNIKFTAQWTPITYTVEYNPNGGSGSTASSTHTYDVAKNLTACGFTNGATVTYVFNGGTGNPNSATVSASFAGWAISPDGKPIYSNGQSVKNLTSENGGTVTLYAKWTDGKLTLPDNPTRTGYTFSGWYTEKDGGNKVENGKVISSDITLYAHWTPITYTVEYNPNGGSGSTASSTHTYDVAQNLTPNGFERKFTVTFNYNYNDGETAATAATATSAFNGWAKSASGAVEYADGASVINLTSENGGTVTLYANWTDASVDVKEAARKGYVFTGWFDENGNSVAIGSYTPKANVTLTARWEVIKYKITFKNGDTILQDTAFAYDTTPTFTGTEPTKKSDNRYEYTFSGWSPEITKVTGEATYEAQFTATEHHFKSVKVDGETHRSECACGYKLESTKHNIELKDGKYTCKDCGYVVPDFNAVTADGATLTKTLRADMTTKYLVATVSYPNASKPNKEGKYFVYWYDKASGEIVSAFTTYSFFLTKEVDIIPIFATQKDYYTERAKATTVLRMVGCKQNEDKSYSILAERSISSSAGSINSHGMIYTTDASLSDSLDWEHRDVNGVKLLTAKRTSTVRTGLYEAKITGAESGVVYARPYIVLVNSDGTTKTMYGKVVTYNLTSTQAAESDVLSTDSYDLSDISAEEPVAPTEPTEKNPLEKIADFFAKLVEIIKTILSFFGLTGVAR